MAAPPLGAIAKVVVILVIFAAVSGCSIKSGGTRSPVFLTANEHAPEWSGAVKLAKEPAHLQGVGEAVQLGEGLDVGDVDLEPRAADVDGDHRGGGAVKAQFNRMDATAHRRAQQAPGIGRYLGKAGKDRPGQTQRIAAPGWHLARCADRHALFAGLDEPGLTFIETVRMCRHQVTTTRTS